MIEVCPLPQDYPEYVVDIEQRLRLVAATVRQKGRLLLGKYGITAPQFEALVVLKDEGERTIGELSSRLFLAYSTMTDLVDRLEKAKYVTRRRSEDDRRVVRVCLEPEGAELIESVLVARRIYLSGALEKVDVDIRKVMLDSLNLLYLNMANQ
jgi:MarR family transcriptional regulator, organic hydroperoxide resistance regulator